MANEEISAFGGFLEYGPIGLAGITIVISVIAIRSSNMSDNQTGMLKFIVSAAVFMFFLALVAEFFSRDAEHELTFAVTPLNITEVEHFAPPDLRVDGQELDENNKFNAKANAQITVDVSEAIAIAQAGRDILVQDLATTASTIDRFLAVQDSLSELQNEDLGTQALRYTLRIRRNVTALRSDLATIENLPQRPQTASE